MHKLLHKSLIREGAMLTSEKLEKGAKGDWKKEGYTIGHHVENGQLGLKHVQVWAKDKNGKTVGNVGAIQNWADKKATKPHNTMTASAVTVHPDHKRKGLASAMYEHAEKVSGLKMKPDTGGQSKEGQKLWSQPNRPFGKSEPLEKMGVARRLKPFNPQEMPEQDEESVARWQLLDPEENGVAQDLREDVPETTGNARFRALNKLSNHTQVKQNPDGTRTFLLHRGISPEESQATIKPNNTYSSEQSSSWTPNYSIAESFTRQHNHISQKDRLTKPISAWVHENNIHAIPKQFGASSVGADFDMPKEKGPNRYADEHEIIIKPNTVHRLHELSGKKDFGSMHPDPNANIDQVIDARDKIKAGASSGIIRPKKLAASEPLDKGAMRTRAPFDPKNTPEEVNQAMYQWQEKENRVGRNILADRNMDENARARALHKLTGKTPTRRSQSGGREFLLHRGMNREEFNHSKGFDKKPKISHSEASSWTPDIGIARDFGHNAGRAARTGGVVSAWVHEGNIKHVPSQLGDPNEKGQNSFANEHEIIVGPGHNSEMVHEKDIPKLIGQKKYPENPRRPDAPTNIDQQINNRGGQSLKFPGDKGVLSNPLKADAVKEYAQQRGRKLAASEPLDKGAMRRRAPFVPTNTAPSTDQAMREWQDDVNDLGRKVLSEKGMDPNARERALHKLTGSTLTRRAASGGREFLLHRGMSRAEFDHSRSRGKNPRISHSEPSSWTPKIETARIFQKENKRGGQNSGIASAWIHEGDIGFIPNQYGEPKTMTTSSQPRFKNSYRQEHEVIVNPGHNSELVHGSELPKLIGKPKNIENNGPAETPTNVNQAINLRGKMNMEGNVARNYSQNKKLAASEPIKSNPFGLAKAMQVLEKPYRSEAQRRWAHTVEGKEVLGGESAVHEWDEATKGKKLPEKMEKRSKNVRAQTRDITPEKRKQRIHQFIARQGVSATPGRQDRFGIGPKQNKLTYTQNAGSAEHEFAHHLMTPKGMGPREYQKQLGQVTAGKKSTMTPEQRQEDEATAFSMQPPIARRAGVSAQDTHRVGMLDPKTKAIAQLRARTVMNSKVLKSEPLEKASKNVREQRKETFGTKSAPKAGSDMQAKHMNHIGNFAKQFLGLDLKPSGGKIDEKTGQRRDENPEIGVDKPDWRSGQLETQQNPDAAVHELAHLMLLPPGVGLKEGQKLMDKKYSDVQKEHGYMKQKQSQGEVQPMAAEQLIRRHLGLPANKNSVPVHDPEMPLRTAVDDPSAVIGTRITQGKDKQGNPKWVDLIRQARNLTPENKQRMHEVFSGQIKFHPERGWEQNTDPNAIINVRAGGNHGEALERARKRYARQPMVSKPTKLAASEKMVKAELAAPKQIPKPGSALATRAANHQANPKIRQAADAYAASRGLKVNHEIEPVKVDPKHANKIATAYEKMPHDPHHPSVRKAYNALIGETLGQYQQIKNSGLKITKMKPGQENPYKNGSKDLFNDINQNNHMYYYPTEQGFGSGGHDASDHPMMAQTGEKDPEGKPMVANDVFRITHDVMGHHLGGYGFGANGEENAYRLHRQMFSPEARKALASETRGQNSWVNFSDQVGEKNRQNPENTQYSEQKAGILPEWAQEEY